MKLTVCDIQLSLREVEVSERCECGADLTAEDAVKIAEYIDASYRGRFVPGGEAGGYEYGDQGFEWYGEDNIAGIAFYCATCSKTIVAGARVEED